MEVINIRDIKKGDYFNFGAFSNVYKVEIDGKMYAYKEYKKSINLIVKNIVSELTEEDYSGCFLTPKYLIESSSGQNILGYLSEYDNNLKDIDDIFDKSKKIRLLKNAKEILIRWHNESKRIHGDINSSNMLFDEEKEKSYFLDFDTSLKINTKFNKNYDIDDFPFSDYVYEYLAYYPFNEEIDTYMFNLTTLLILSNKSSFLDLMEVIRFEKLDIIKENKDVKRLSKKLLFIDTKKSFGKDYIIDYIN